MSEEQIKELATSAMLETMKENLDSAMIFTYIEGLEQENKRLNNIIEELEKYLIEYSQDLEFRCYANTFLEKIQELKGDGSNGN